MKVYVDSSVVLRRLLLQPGRIENWASWDVAVTSQLTAVESRRSLDRLRVRGKLADFDMARLRRLLDATLEQVDVIPIGAAVLERAASPFPTVLGTLDAIHLASALLWVDEKHEPLTLLTHDQELAIAAQASGFTVRGA